MTDRCDAKAALTGCRDVRAALFGCQGEETHASSAAWSYGTDRNGTSAGARGKQKAREKEKGRKISWRRKGRRDTEGRRESVKGRAE